MAIQYCDYDIKGTLAVAGNATFASDITVSGGDITLGGTGRIQGIDTVSAGTDAANKNYVDNAIPFVGNGTLTVQGTTVLSGSGTFTANQSGNKLISIIHSNSGATAGSYTNANVTVNASGHITSVSNGSDNQGVTSVATGNGISGGTITSTGTLTVGAGDGLSQSSTGLLMSGSYSNSFTVGSTSSTSRFIRVLASDSNTAGLEAYGNSQGTGYAYVGQASSYGGGMFYNGDGSPTFATGEVNDAISFYRRSNNTNETVFYYPQNSNNVTFRGDITVSGGDITLGGTGRIQGIDTVFLSTDAANKAYVDAHTSGIGGSGTTNFIPMFTPNGTTLGNSQISQANIGTGNAKRITVASRMTITGSGGDADGGTLNLSSNSARLGICTSAYPGSITEPEASLDVGKNARIRGSLNVGSTDEQYLFVSTTGDTPVGYVKMGYYGSGVEWGSSTSTTRTPQYSTGFGSGGKVVEDARYYTFKISFDNMATIDTNPRVLIAQDTGLYTYIVEDFYVFQDNANSNNPAPVFNSDLRLDYKYTPDVGTVRTSTAWVVPQATISRDANARKRRTLMQGVSAGALSVSGAGLQEGTGTAYARASVILTASSVTSQTGSGDYYLRLKVKKINIGNDIINNTQTITIT